MTKSNLFSVLRVATLLVVGGCSAPIEPTKSRDAETRAIRFLQREVPAWSRDNGCFSCHNNGDAARALYTASRSDYRVPNDSLAETTQWLAQPSQWDKNKGDPGFSDQRLADVQFAAALLTAIETGHADAPQALEESARRLIKQQADDGTWPVDAGNQGGSPATYGTTLATFMALRVLSASELPEAVSAAHSAERALLKTPTRTVPDAATLLWFTTLKRDAATLPIRERCREFLRAAQNGDGGWGPYDNAPSEVFDTALALLALAKVRDESDVGLMLARGKTFLLAMQLEDGSWPATTRPSGGISYAQQMSTTGWAALALLAMRER